MDLDTGVAVRIGSEDLDELRDELADSFHGLLSAQDSGGWIPHVTIQNKVQPKMARALLRSIEPTLERNPVQIDAIGLYRYAEGAWEPLVRFPFRR